AERTGCSAADHRIAWARTSNMRTDGPPLSGRPPVAATYRRAHVTRRFAPESKRPSRGARPSSYSQAFTPLSGGCIMTGNGLRPAGSSSGVGGGGFDRRSGPPGRGGGLGGLVRARALPRGGGNGRARAAPAPPPPTEESPV